jgi:hypothetical protein
MVFLREATGWVALVISIAGLGVSAMYLGKVRGAGVLLAGFALQAFSSLLFRLSMLFMGRLSVDAVVPALGFGSAFAVAGSLTIVIALSGILRRAATTPIAAGS